MIGLARDRFRPGSGCVAVALDGDGKDITQDEPHVAIASGCQAAGVALLVLREAMEAWLLADAGCCAWLSIPHRRNTATITDPKALVSNAFQRKTGRTYQRRRARMEIARHASGPDATRNVSIREAMNKLRACQPDAND